MAGTDKQKAFGEVAFAAYVPHNYPLDKLEPRPVGHHDIRDNSLDRLVEAINDCFHVELGRDPDVMVLGEDVGRAGGVFRATAGLRDTFGPDRCFDTPLAEAGIAGFAVGLAMNGMRPVIEMQFDAFAYPAFEQIASHVAKMRNRTRGAVAMPIVIRIPYAGGIGGVEHHCDSSEAYYAHTPGLKVFTPATVEDAYLLLREAIDSDDPVVFFEPKKLYWSKAPVDLAAHAEAFVEGGRLARRLVDIVGNDGLAHGGHAREADHEGNQRDHRHLSRNLRVRQRQHQLNVARPPTP